MFLDGLTDLANNRSWAGNLAGKVVDVVAVVNRIQVIERSPWDISPAVSELNHIWRGVVQGVARFGLGLVVLMLVGMIAKLAILELRRILNHRINPLLRNTMARTTMESKEKMFDAGRKYINTSSKP